MGAVFVASVFVLGTKLLNSTPIQVFVNQEDTAITQIPGFFTFNDVMVVVVSSLVLGISTMYILSLDSGEKPAGRLVLEERKKRWVEIVKTMREDEQRIYQAIIDSDGIINQSELAGKTGLSKSNVSRNLDLLESKGLVERRRRGMGNIILLK